MKKKPNILFKYWGQGECNADDPQLSLGWYRHSKSHRYWGFTVRFGFFGHTLDVTAVNDTRYYLKFYDEENPVRLIPWR